MSLITNLVSYWKLDESSGNAADSVGSNTGTNANVTYSPHLINNGGVFNGSSSELDVGTSSTLNPTSAFSINFWFRSTSIGTAQMLFARDTGVGVGADRCWGTKIISSKFNFDWFSSSTVSSITGGTTLSSDTDYMATAVYDGSEIRIYINGVSDATAVSTSGTPFTSAENTYLGRRGYAPDPRWLAGKMDEVGFWDRALTGSEITELNNSGSGNQYPFSPEIIITPSAQVSTFSLPEETVLIENTETPVSQNIISETPGPSLLLGAVETPGAQTGIFSLPVASVLTPDELINASVQSLTASIPSFLVGIGVAIEPVSQDLISSTPSPILLIAQIINPSPLGALFTAEELVVLESFYQIKYPAQGDIYNKKYI